MAGKGRAKAARQVAAADSVPASNNVSADATKTIVKPPGVTAFRPRVPAPLVLPTFATHQTQARFKAGEGVCKTPFCSAAV